MYFSLASQRTEPEKLTLKFEKFNSQFNIPVVLFRIWQMCAILLINKNLPSQFFVNRVQLLPLT